MREYLKQFEIKGFKSIKDQTVKLQPDLNVLIGANASGKSNFIGSFVFIRHVVDKQLERYVVEHGGAAQLMHYGSSTTQSLSLSMTFQEQQEDRTRSYRLDFISTTDDRLAIDQETVFYHEQDRFPDPYSRIIARNKLESRLRDVNARVSTFMLKHVDAYKVFHFHNTTSNAPPRLTRNLHETAELYEDGGNIAAWLYGLAQNSPGTLTLIERLVQQVAPTFDMFHLRPSMVADGHIRLRWRERFSAMPMDVSAMSDGTLRFICLAALLLQPNPPPVIIIDEPELGLHPHAIRVLAEMLKSVATKSQVIVSTQSVTLVNQMSPESVWCVDRQEGASVFRHLNDERFRIWLEDYAQEDCALGDLWESNLVWEDGMKSTVIGVP